MVDAVPLARARRPGAPRARQQPDARAGAGEAASGAGRPERAQRRDQLPKLDAKLSANRVDVNPQSLGVPALPVPMPLDLYLASISVSYTFDFAGGTRRELEGLRAEVDHQQYELEAARLMLAGNVVTTAIREASLREQIAQTRRSLRCRRASSRSPSGWKRSAAWPAPT